MTVSILKNQCRWGDRVKFLVNDMEESPLKMALDGCLDDATLKAFAHPFSIGHRGACLQYPEHTMESYVASMYQGAGIVECDVAVTLDGELVCRHAQCDLHTTTNILATNLASKCRIPFTPANATTSATVECCTSDVTLAEFKSLCGKMDASDSSGETVEAYMDGTANWRTDLYSTCGTVVSHAESIALIQDYHRKFTPELKTYTQSDASMPTYDEVRAKVAQEYLDAGVDPGNVWLQSFNMPDMDYWIANYPSFGAQAVFLDNGYCNGTLADCPQTVNFSAWRAAGYNYYAPPIQMLVQTNAASTNWTASELALEAIAAGFNIISWTVERSGPLVPGDNGFYYGSTTFADNDGDVFELINVLAQEVGVVGLFSDWPGTTTFYANCLIAYDSESWHKKDDTSKDCPWVSDLPEKRCDTKGENKELASDYCQKTCGPVMQRRRL